MGYSKGNKEIIQNLLNDPEFVYEEYILNNKSTYTLADEWNIPKSSVYNIAKKLGYVGIKIKDKICSCDESLFDKENPIFCYLAGLISADGYISEQYHRVTLRMNEDAKDILKKIKEYFGISSEVVAYSGDGGYTNGYTMYNLTISNRKLLAELRELNIYGRKKDLGVRFPDMSLLSDECQEMYMRGLWDGDGAHYSSSLHTSILEESQLMIDAIRNYIKYKFNIDMLNEKRKFPCIAMNGKDTIQFYNWMYRDNMDFKIDNKYNTVMSVINLH